MIISYICLIIYLISFTWISTSYAKTIELAWDVYVHNPLAPAQRLILQRKVGAGVYVDHASFATTVTTTTDKDVAPGDYCYVMVTTGTTGRSLASNEVCTIISPLPPPPCDDACPVCGVVNTCGRTCPACPPMPPVHAVISGQFVQQKWTDGTWRKCTASGPASKAALTWIRTILYPPLIVAATGTPSSSMSIVVGQTLSIPWNTNTNVVCIATGKSASKVLVFPPR